MKALVVGYGSIGERHARVLNSLGLEVAVVSRRDGDGPPRYPTLDQALDKWAPDYVVIASRTHEHHADITTLAKAGFTGIVLAEKPLFDALKQVPANLFSGFFIGYNMRFHPVVRKLKDLLSGERIFSATFYAGQYLPEWRPGTDYRKSASARRQEGGGVLRDLSHELDMINWIFGDWVWLTAAGGRFGDLEIDSDDVFSLLIKTDRCPVASVQMSYLDRVWRREITVTTSERTYRGDLLGGVLKAEYEVDRFEVGRDDTYVAEHKAVLAGGDMGLCTVAEAFKTVKMIDAAEKAARDNVWVAA